MRIALAVVGVVAIGASRLPWQPDDLVVFGANDRSVGAFGLGHKWLDWLPLLAAAAGVLAVICALVSSRRLRAVTAAVLFTTAGFLAAWLLEPPADVLTRDGAPFGFRWPAYVAASALAIGAIAAAWLAIRRPAATAHTVGATARGPQGRLA
jgi:hypothetical protein